MNTVLAQTPLTNADRCDRCGAQAYARVVLADGELLFCAHHMRKHRDQLEALAVRIDDQSERLSQTPSTAGAEEL